MVDAVFPPAASAPRTGVPSPRAVEHRTRPSIQLDADALAVAVYACRNDDWWTCVQANVRLAGLTGFPVAAWTGERTLWLEQVHPEDRDRLVAERLRLAPGRPMSIQYRLHRSDGELLWVQDLAVLDGDDDQATLIRGALVDVTPWRRSHEVVAQLHAGTRNDLEQLRAQEESREVFQRLLAHDLRGALAIVQGMLATVEEHGDSLGDDQRDLLVGRALSNARRAHRMLEDVLELDRLRHQSGPDVPRPPVRLREVVASVAGASDERRERVHLDVPDVSVPVDAAAVRRIVDNLVANATQHTTGAIHVRARHDAATLRITVSDEGEGIPPGVAEQIFEPYVRLEGSQAGIGLGLYLVRRLTEMQRGRVWVEGQGHRGAAFHVELPLRA